MVAPLRELDPELSSFAAAHGLEVDHNYHNMPNRMLKWTSSGIQRVIQITLYGDNKILLAISAYQDEGGRRRGKRWPPTVDIPLPEFKRELESLLADAYRTLTTVSSDGLEYWT